MSLDPAVLDALLAAGASAEMIVAAVKADAAREDARREEKRGKDAERKRRSRAMSAMSRGHSVTGADGGGQAVTATDLPEERKVSPCTPSKETQPSLPPSSPEGDEPTPTPESGLDEISLAVVAYNDVATAVGWSRAQKLTDARRVALRCRLKDCGGIDGWRGAMERARGSPFLTGDNDRGWVAGFDFFLQAKSFTKLMEGAYDRRDGANRPQNQHVRGPSGASQRIAAMADEIAERRERRFPAEDPGMRGPDRSAAPDSGGDVLPFGGPFVSGIR